VPRTADQSLPRCVVLQAASSHQGGVCGACPTASPPQPMLPDLVHQGGFGNAQGFGGLAHVACVAFQGIGFVALLKNYNVTTLL